MQYSVFDPFGDEVFVSDDRWEAEGVAAQTPGLTVARKVTASTEGKR